MPDLEISPADVGPLRTRRVLGYLESVMLHPHDPDRRAATMQVVEAELLMMATDEHPGPVPLSRSEIGILRDAPRRVDAMTGAKGPFTQGSIAGFIVVEAVGRRAIGHPLSGLQHVKSAAASGLERQRGFSLSSIENTIWPRYRPVAHLFAAWLHGSAMYRDVLPEATFPCALQYLPEFLALAEAYREAAELHKPDGSDTFLLPPGQAWRVPEGIELPKVTLDFDPR